MIENKQTGMERALACASLSLAPPYMGEPERAADKHQYPIGHQIGHWTITGETWLHAVRRGDSGIRRYPTAPVRCVCGTESTVRVTFLRNGMTSSCGCVPSGLRNHVGAEWRARGDV